MSTQFRWSAKRDKAAFALAERQSQQNEIRLHSRIGAANMKWAIEIQKTSLEQRNLSDLLNGLGFNLVEGIQYPALTSPQVDSCTTASDAFEKAKAERAAFKEAAQIDPEFALGSVIDYSTDAPRRHAFIEVQSCYDHV